MKQFIKNIWQEMIRYLWVFFIFLALVITSIVTWILTAVYDHPLDLFYFFLAILSSGLIVFFVIAFIIEAVRHSRKEDLKD